MSAPEEYLCTSRPSISLASSIWAQTSSIILELLPRHPTGPLVCELDQGFGWLPSSDACAGRGRRQLASAIFEIHGQELVSGEIFNGSSGKSVIAEGLANASLWGNRRASELDRETASHHFRRTARFLLFRQDEKTYIFHFELPHILAYKSPFLIFPFMGFYSFAIDSILDAKDLFSYVSIFWTPSILGLRQDILSGYDKT